MPADLSRKPRGFTLLELVLTLIIVSTLSAVALSKMIVLDQQSTLASLKSMAGSLSAGSQINRASLAARSPSAFEAIQRSMCDRASLSRFSQTPIDAGISIAPVSGADSCAGASNEVASCVLSSGASQTTVQIYCARGDTPAVWEPGGWTECSGEAATCSFSGTRDVRYGANGVFYTRTATGSIWCDNDTFGDPIQNVVKTCSYSNATR